MKPETRRFKSDLKVERREDGKAAVISGYAIVYNRDSEDLGFIETIKRGASKKALKKSDIRYLIDHIPNLIVGRGGKNLTFREDKEGVWIELVRPKVKSERFEQLASDVDNGFIDAQSFAFTVVKDGAKWNDDFSRREVIEINEIFDFSAVTYPAYPDTNLGLRSQDTTVALEERKKAMESIEQDQESEDQTDPSVELDVATTEEGDEIPSNEPPTEDELDKRILATLKRLEGF